MKYISLSILLALGLAATISSCSSSEEPASTAGTGGASAGVGGATTCGNGVLDAGETCDPVTTCPDSCDDADGCTVDTKTGSLLACNVVCGHTVKTSCEPDDNCCPANCDATTDKDCQAPGAGGSGAGGATGAGGGTVAPSCSDVAPCGGDVVGTWAVTDSCVTITGTLDMSALGIGCSSAPVEGTMEVAGSWTLNADGTYTDTTTTSGTAKVELEAGCLNVSGTVTTCPKVGRVLPSAGFTTATCVPNAATAGCSCDTTIQQSGGLGVVSFNAAASGTYTTAGTVLTAVSGGFNEQYGYCVAGNALTMTIPVGKLGAAAGKVIFQK